MLSQEVVPSPVYPSLHVHVKDPVVSVHVTEDDGDAQLCWEVVHSLKLVHVMPLPEYPRLHVHTFPLAQTAVDAHEGEQEAQATARAPSAIYLRV